MKTARTLSAGKQGDRVLTAQVCAISRTLAREIASGEGKMQFEHIGLIAKEKKAREDWVEATRVWVTNPREHPFHVEWLRYEPDSPVTGPVREKSHVAYSVEKLSSS